ncbi:VacB/RNase II family 3'-5' exoribonuclease [Oceanicoccus sp. KOV_DT_Chl]|uniref:VacB/RNase II family 3'-5' exoribonuclease n=1 Tax=Oceanicoccus sp. KOV_DT_Chl TaxID=1904639 RepID=UPI000C7C0BEE|nr:VacB/RNase II family 3'-5' exoribonuclease [Oceanicoccus sp. KOV_DT_Chl]
MLDNNTLSQLKQLKQEIEDSKEYAEGIVKGTQRKFGFVVLSDDREIYLNPEEMLKVLPGDSVKILITTEENKKNKDAKPKTSGTIEKLISSTLKEFSGRYIVKGQGHFVEPDLPQLSRWIFIPPQARKNAKAGDFIHCKIHRHPYPEAKPQAKILEVIGAADRDGIEADYIINKFQLTPQWPTDWQQSLLSIDETSRQDITSTPFITIDAASTVDMDDALYASSTDQGWQLQIAIADPNALIKPESALDKAIKQQATSVYLPGKAIAMLPAELANEQCSLMPDQIRPALVCQIEIKQDGSISGYKIIEALIKSQAKLSYFEVANCLDHAEVNENCNPHSSCLAALKALSDALSRHRQQHNLVIPNRQEYRLVLNQQLKLDHIELQQKSSAHQLVEECMIAANRCASDMLGDSGIFISHPGFRKERLADVKKLAEEQLALTDCDFSTPEGYRQLMNAIDDEALNFPLRSVLSRLLERSRLTAKPQPHYGMGMQSYTTFTSPIRKYSDLLVHRIIKAKLQKQSQPVVDEQTIAALQLAQDKVRQAYYQLEQWLKCQYMKPLVGKEFSGTVSQINSNGFSVRLDEHLIEGFIETKLLNEKYSFDPMRLKLTSKSQTVQLDQTITVQVKEVDCKQRTIRYTLAAVAAAAESIAS